MTIFFMKSKLLKPITNASKRICIKTFLLDDKLVDYLIKTKDVDIRIAIHDDWINKNIKYLEKLLENKIPIFIHNDIESFIIIDDSEMNLECVEEEVKKSTLEKLIKKNFENDKLLLSKEMADKYKLDILINEIKDEFRLVIFSKTGTKVYKRKINFASLLKKQSKQKVVADEEKFELYDKKFLSNNLKNSLSEDEFNNLKKEYDNLMELCSKYNVFGDNIKNKYSCGKFNKFILVDKSNISNIIKDINKINNINKNINERCFNILMDEFYKNFELKLSEVLKRHDIYDNMDVENFKKRIKGKIPKAKTIKENIKIDNFMILELSREMLLDEKIIRKLKSFIISDEVKDKLNQLENLIK